MTELLSIWSFIAATLAFFWSRRALERLDRQAVEIRRLRDGVPGAAKTPVAAEAPVAPPPKPRGLPKRPAAAPMRAAPPPPRPEGPPSAPPFDWPISWEDFTAARMFSWAGGLALFLGAAFFVKYSIERELLTPLMRVLLGALTGFAAVAAGVLLERRGERKVVVTAHTLCAAGVGILYADAFAAHASFGLMTLATAAVLMGATTTGAFLLSVRMNSRTIAVLALLSGFLTPPLLWWGQERTLLLFAYTAVLVAGGLSTAVWKRWGFLAVLAAVGTAATQWGWAIGHFDPASRWAATAVFAFFPVLFAAAREWGVLSGASDEPFDAATGIPPLSALVFAGCAVHSAAGTASPGLFLGLAVGAGALTALLALRSEAFVGLHAAAGALSTLILASWMVSRMNGETLWIGLVVTGAFALLHAAFSWLLAALRPDAKPPAFAAVAALAPLALVAIAVFRGWGESSGLWFAVLLADAAAIAAAAALGASWLFTASMLATMALFGLRIGQMAPAAGMGNLLATLGVFSLGFFALAAWLRNGDRPEEILSLPSLSSLVPYTLLAFAALRVPSASPHSVFLFCAGLGLLNALLIRRFGADDSSWGALAGAFLVASAWALHPRSAASFAQALPWFTVLFAIPAATPFLDPEVSEQRAPVWTVAALAGPAMFLPIHRAVVGSLGDAAIGALPALFAALYALACRQLIGGGLPSAPVERARLAWFGGVALFFLSLIVPLQFDKEWITLGWAFEGAALLLLYRVLPHPGIKTWAVGLFALVFLRLAANPAVFFYHPRSGVPVLNWFLWVYGAAAAALFAGARLWSPPEESRFGRPVAGSLQAAGTILAFLLLNIEIADFFSTGAVIVFAPQGNLAKDLAYTLGWGVFATVLLVAGLSRDRKDARMAGVGLLGVAALKLFLHDLWRLGQLYRVASSVGLAGILIGASFLWQKFRPGDE